jgi:hypothetical protein
MLLMLTSRRLDPQTTYGPTVPLQGRQGPDSFLGHLGLQTVGSHDVS